MSLSQNATDALIISGAVALVLVLLVAYYCYRRRANRAALNQHLLDEQNGGSVNNNGIVDKNATSIVGYDGASPLPRKGVVDSSHYRVKKALGDGAYGSVYLAVRRTDHTNVAVKVIPCRSEQEAKESMNEFHIAQSVQDHPNVVKVFDVFVDSPVDENGGGGAAGNGAASTAGQQQQQQKGGGSPKHAGSSGSSMLQALRVRAPAAAQYLCIVSEYCQEGTLFDLLITVRTANNAGRKMGNASTTTATNNNGATTTTTTTSPQPAAAAAANSTQALPPNRRTTTTTTAVAGLAEDIVWAYTEQLLEALSFLHSRNLMHRDLKPSNVLLTDNHRKILLTDFGLSRVVEEKEYAKTRTGTLQYMSPEQVQRRYNNKGDVWGVGCLVHAMCTAKVSTSEAKIMFRDRQKENFEATMRSEDLLGYSKDLADFMLELLAQSYQDRPSAQQALEMCKQLRARRQ